MPPYLSSLFGFFLLSRLVLLTHSTHAQVIVTVAGTGHAGYSGDGGLATSANLNVPTSIAFDKAGNLLIADQENYVIRKLDLTTGIITTIAGTGGQGHSGDGGPANRSTIWGPTGLAIDKTGNIFIAEEYGSTIRKIDANTGIINTFAGVPNAGFSYSGDGGPATNAGFYQPTDVTLDAFGNVYITDWQNNVVREVASTTGIINTIAGYYPGIPGYSGDGGQATLATLNQCPRIFLDPTGNLLIGDQGNNVIRKVDATTGIIHTIIGSGINGYAGDGGPANKALLNQPSAVIMDAKGAIYIADSYNNVIRFVDASTGNISTVAGNGLQGYSGDGGPALNASFYRPVDLALDAAGNLYIADARNNVIRKINLCPPVSLGNNTTICSSDSILLDAGNKYSEFQWNTGATTPSIEVRLPGTYWVMATDPNSKCISRDTIQISQFPPVSFNWPSDFIICDGSTIVLNAPAGTSAIQWQDGSSGPSYVVRQPGTYWARLEDANHCSDSDTLRIRESVSAPSPYLPADTSICNYATIDLQSARPFLSYLWSTGDTTAKKTVDQGGEYWLQVEDSFHCTWKDTILVKVKNCKESIVFPDAFTPNNDGKNDVFRPIVQGVMNHFSMAIYNRWGQLVFSTKNWAQGWDGTFHGLSQEPGTYVWSCTYQLSGFPNVTRGGTVILVR